jgi:hypothetical protein
MKKAILGIILGHQLILSSICNAGGPITSGGGGTTNPNKVDPTVIINVLGRGTGFALKSFFIAQKNHYDLMTSNDQQSSAYFKLFNGKKTIFEVIDNATIEAHMSKPCLDFDGQEREGSINTVKAGAVCISPFLMAQKLDQYNVSAETIGLIAHELSHLLGTDEGEAVTIQKDFIDSAYGVDFFKKRSELSSRINSVFSAFLFNLKRAEEGSLRTIYFFSFLRDSTFNYRDLFYTDENFHYSFIKEGYVNSTIFSRLDNLYISACMKDSSLPDYEIARCHNLDDLCFQNQATASAYDCYRRWNPQDVVEDEFKNIIFNRPNTEDNIQKELGEVTKYIVSLSARFDKLVKFEFPIDISL